MELRYESGGENKGSLLLSRANLEQAKLDLLKAKDQVPASRALLLRALGRESGGANDALDVIGDGPSTPPPEPTPAFARVATELPEAQQARQLTASARADVNVARAAFWPSLDLRGSIGRQSDDGSFRQERWSAGLTLTIPLFNGGRDWYGVGSASALASSAEAQFSGAIKQLLANLTQSYLNFVEAAQALKVNATFVDATETRAEIARRKYENGLLSFEDWDIIENDLINRQRTYLQSKRDRVLAERAWRQATSQEEPLEGSQ